MPLPKITRDENGNVPQEETKTDAGQNSDRPSRARGAAAHELITDDERDRVVDTLLAGLTATKSYQQNGKMVESPDHATRAKCAELLLAYKVGRPVERKVTLTGDFASYDSKLEKLLGSAEGMRIAIAAGLVEPLEKTAKVRRGAGSISTRQSQEGKDDAQSADNQGESA